MEDLVDAELVKDTAISNFNHTHIGWLLSKPGLKYKPANNQIESHPFLPQEELISFCHSKGISVTAYCLLGLASGHGKNILLSEKRQNFLAVNAHLFLQVLIWFQIQRNMCVIPKSITPHHIEENFQLFGIFIHVFDFELIKEVMETILSFKKRYRICTLSEYLILLLDLAEYT
uniref:NADP-dependent oxidoreductase domain-containing protein n=1 Tax=Nothoprocta perdicaria TaxID=30464 RepID=A0A8C7A633_NOTPE